MATTAGRCTTHPMSYYWGVVKDMDDRQKLELITLLAESVKPAIKREQSDAGVDSAELEQARPEVKPKMMAEHPMKRFTMDDINAMLDEAEGQIAAGNVIDDEDVWRELEEEFAREDAEEDALRAAYVEEPQSEAV